jgi:integrase
MLKKFNFTKQSIEALLPADKRYSVSDTKANHLYLTIFPSGTKTFVLYRKIKGQPQQIKIGRYVDISIEQARKQAFKYNAVIGSGGDPIKERNDKRDEITFKDLYEHYFNQHALLHTKRPNDNKKMLEGHVFPKIGHRKLSDITAEKIRQIHASIGTESGTGGANRVITVVNAIFNFGIKNGYFKLANPCFGLKKFKEFSRDRFLSRAEVKLFSEALNQETDLFRDYFLILLYTAARKSNVLSMQWSDIDLDLKRWRISEKQSKNNDVNVVHLSEEALLILHVRKEINNALLSPSRYVFPSNVVDGHLKDPKKSFQRIKDRMNVQDIRIHDLRRTLASYMAISGVSLPIIGKALNHKSQDSTAIYARLDNRPVLDAINMATQVMSQSL